jgi:hypothetical protein
VRYVEDALAHLRAEARQYVAQGKTVAAPRYMDPALLDDRVSSLSHLGRYPVTCPAVRLAPGNSRAELHEDARIGKRGFAIERTS